MICCLVPVFRDWLHYLGYQIGGMIVAFMERWTRPVENRAMDSWAESFVLSSSTLTSEIPELSSSSLFTCWL